MGIEVAVVLAGGRVEGAGEKREVGGQRGLTKGRDGVDGRSLVLRKGLWYASPSDAYKTW